MSCSDSLSSFLLVVYVGFDVILTECWLREMLAGGFNLGSVI